MFSPAIVLTGLIVGLSLGLTGGGGAIFAVPLLVYGLGISAQEAVLVSLVAVGSISALGAISYWRSGKVELRTGLLFAVAGMLGAPWGTWLSQFLPEELLLLLFAGLMLVIAVKLWVQGEPSRVPVLARSPDCAAAPTCQRDETGLLILTSRCALLLVMVGVGTGILSGLFGVGGGFVIVPALVIFSGLPVHRAVGTSLMVIVLVSNAGVVSKLAAGQAVPWRITTGFVLTGVLGLFAGEQLGRYLPARTLQRVFVAAIVVVAVFVILQNL